MDPITQQGLAGAAGASDDPLYVDDVFSTFLYVGAGGTQTITNGIDLSGEGGMVHIKNRSTNSYDNIIFNTERGSGKFVRSNQNYPESNSSSSLSAFNSDGFTLGAYTDVTANTSNFCSWTFRKAPGFFDVVTYNGASNNGDYNTWITVPHNLGSTPGCVIIKSTSNAESWVVWHRGDSSKMMMLNSAGAANASNYSTVFGHANGAADADNIYVRAGQFMAGASGYSYVAFVFAHDDQSFGTNSDEAIIKCGSYTGNGNANGPSINLGFEPQYLWIKNTGSTGSWWIMDVMRGMPLNASDELLSFDGVHQEYTSYNWVKPSPTGFKLAATDSNVNANGYKYVYMAIRRSHKPPETATEVFDVGTRSGSSSDAKTNSSIFTDMSFIFRRDSQSEYNGITQRITGANALQLNSISANLTGFTDADSSKPWSYMTGLMIGGGNGAGNTGNLIDFSFKRAPGFFDCLTYEGNGTSRTIAHNLEAVPEMIWVKGYDNGLDWFVYSSVTGNDSYLMINANYAKNNSSSMNLWDSTTPTSSVFSIRANNNVNYSGGTFVAYLFASLDGISKVGGYTGTGNNINVDCGFSSGARFVMIKRTDSSGAWYVWNSARGIVSGNDPYYRANTTDQEVTGTDYIDPLNSGFTVTSSANAEVNANGGNYMFYAIA